MTANQTDALNRIYEATRNGLQVSAFNVSHKQIVNSSLRMHRRGILCIPLDNGYMGRALVAIPDESGQRIESLNVSLSYAMQIALGKDGRIICKESKLHYQDLAIRGCDMRLTTGNKGNQFLVAEPCSTPDKNGVITPFQVAHAWYPRIETVRQEMPMQVRNQSVVRRQTEVKQIAISDYGELSTTNSIKIDGNQSAMEIAHSAMYHKYTMGVYSSIREDILTCRLSAFGDVIMEVAEIREEKIAAKAVEILIEQAIEHHLSPKTFGL